MDYVNDRTTLALSVIEHTCFTYRVINDNAYELFEDFFINITSPNQSLILMPNSVAITIKDDDSK